MNFLVEFEATLPNGVCLDSLKNIAPEMDWDKSPELACAYALSISGIFDVHDYLERYPDVASAKVDPIEHFVCHGIWENRYFNLSKTPSLDLKRLFASQKRVNSDKFLCPKVRIDESKETYSIIVTLWKRKNYLTEQYMAFMRQSHKPEEIIYIINGNHISADYVRTATGPTVKIIQSGINSLYTRFALSYIAQGQYVAIVDDDIIPGEYWFANAMRASREYGALVVGSGRIYNPEGIQGFYTYVIPTEEPTSPKLLSCAESDIFCDWGCNSYFFKRDWVSSAIGYDRYAEATKTYDDIQIAISLFRKASVPCVCPMQPLWDNRFHASLKLDYGNDCRAIWLHSAGHFPLRKAFLEEQIATGYVPVCERDDLYKFHIIVPFIEHSMLERCLLSIKAQIYNNYTCSLISDCDDEVYVMDLIEKLNLDRLQFRFIQSKRRLWPLRTRELATDMLAANLSDVIVHLDGDDWFAHPHVLWQLNRIYRKGDALITYGNAVSVRDPWGRDFKSYDNLPMSRAWDITQLEPNAPWLPYGRLRKEDVSEGWGSAPCSAMHTRSFIFSRWLLLNRKSFRYANDDYIRRGTDTAIMIPMLDFTDFEAIKFSPDISYVYQNGDNTSVAKKDIDFVEITAMRKAIASASKETAKANLAAALVIPSLQGNIPPDAEIKYDNMLGNAPKNDKTPYSQTVASCVNKKTAIVTIITPDYLTEGLLCLASYQRNLQPTCTPFIYVTACRHLRQDVIRKIFEVSGFKPIFNSDLRYTRDKTEKLEQKYGINSDNFRWAMKSVILQELLQEGFEAALYMDSDIYTVSDISDIHRQICSHSISLFPHFRNPDREDTRAALYGDGMFNGGMLGATSCGMSSLEKLYLRCLGEMVKDRARNRYDDQKYLELMLLETDNCYVNKDHGINYNNWNRDDVVGLVSPSQRSYLLKNGQMARIWHMTSSILTDSIDKKDFIYAAVRPIGVIYTLTRFFIAILLQLHIQAMPDIDDVNKSILQRIYCYNDLLKRLSPDMDLDGLWILVNRITNSQKTYTHKNLEAWTQAVTGSICFDNLELFASLLLNFFGNSNEIMTFVNHMRRFDLRYITENVIANNELDYVQINDNIEIKSAGLILKERLQKLNNAKLYY